MAARRVLFVMALAAAMIGAPAARAIPSTCLTTGPDAGTVIITEPTAGTTFAGQVTVRGRASATGGLNRVELFVGEALRDFQVYDPAQPSVEFLLRFDVANVQASTAKLSVVACGGTPGAAVRGGASIDVRVDRASVSTKPSIVLTPVERADDPNAAKTGPPWVAAAFGLAGLIGLVAASRVRRARVATGPSPVAGAAVGAGPPGRAPRDRRPRGPGGTAQPPSPTAFPPPVSPPPVSPPPVSPPPVSPPPAFPSPGVVTRRGAAAEREARAQGSGRNGAAAPGGKRGRRD